MKTSPRLIELAWCAGFFDGEGSFQCKLPRSRNGKYFYPRYYAQLAQSDREVLDRFALAVGVGKVRGPYGPYKAQSKPFYQWATTRYSETSQVIRLLEPYLSSIKWEQGMKAMADFLDGKALIKEMKQQ